MNVTIPTSWNKLTGRQLARVANTLLSKEQIENALEDLGHESDIRMRLFWDLVPFTWWKLKDWMRVYRLLRIPDYELKPYAEFLLEPKPKLTKWVFGRLRLTPFSKVYHGPDRDLRHVSWHEFTLADTLYLKFRESSEPFYLHMLCATLFRPQGEEDLRQPEHYSFIGDCRRGFNPNIPDKDLERVSRWPERYHHAVLLNYEGIRRQIELEYPRVFSSENEEEVIHGPKGWEPVTISLAGVKFGSYKDTQATPFRTVLKHMEMNAIEIERLKAGRE